MEHRKISPEQYPPKNGESWWIVHPNKKGVEFRVPIGAVTVCTLDIEGFFTNMAYAVVGVDNHNGWVTLRNGDNLYDMPQYLFARHFDAEVFVVGTYDPAELEGAKPFNYKPTLPKSFKDNIYGPDFKSNGE